MSKIFVFTILLISILFSKELITPIPTFDNYTYNYKKAKLGQKLFNDTRLSQNNTISCSSCHLLDQGGDDNLVGPYGIHNQFIPRNSPTVFNAVFNVYQHWDASTNTLEEQAKSSIEHKLAMNSNFKEILDKLKLDKLYIKEFKSIYNEIINEKNILDAIASFEKALITPNSKFDKYLKGNKNSLNKKELNGYKLFKDYGCISCHNGINVGGNLIQKIGIVDKYKTDDFGRFHLTNNINDKYYFKVPSLRNVALTSPYFHDGKFKTLKSAVNEMLLLQVGYPLNDNQIDDIVEFLKTLSGEMPKILQENTK